MIIPKDVENKILELGFDSIITVVKLYNLWSLVVIKGVKRYNVQLSMDDLSVVTIHLLHYKYNQWGSRIMNVERFLIQEKDV